MKKIICILVFCVILSGCSAIRETGKVIWGTSTRALEEAREDGIEKTFQCSYEQCFTAVLSLTRNEDIEPVSDKKVYDIFLKDWVKGYVIVIGIHGNVDTTEVGIFLEVLDNNKVKVNVSSLSSSAKQRVAGALFNELGLKFYEV